MAGAWPRLGKLGQLILLLLAICNTLEANRSDEAELERRLQCIKGRCARCGTLVVPFPKFGSYTRVADGVWDVKCRRGYDLKGSSRRTCRNRNGTFVVRGRRPRCAANCSNSQNFKNGHMVSESTCGGRQPCKVSFRCNSGYVLKGYPELRCRQGKNWTAQLPKCNRATLKCEDPKHPRNGFVRSNRSLLVFGCRRGFLLKGNETITCNSTTGNWSSEAPWCVGKNETCDESPDPFENGHVTRRGCSQTSPCKYTFHCNEGFVLNGAHHITCDRGQLWEEVGGLPECVGQSNTRDAASSIESGVFNNWFTDVYDFLTDRQRSVINAAIGYDLVLLFSTSPSIAPSDLNRLVSFTEALITRLNAANKTGEHRVSAISFGNVAHLEFSLNETGISENMTAVRNKLRAMQPRRGRGEAGISAAFNLIDQVIAGERRRHATPLIMLLTDGNGFPTSSTPLTISPLIRQFDIYAISIGSGSHIRHLMELVSQPYQHHLFLLRSFGMLSFLTDALLENRTDYNVCGISGNSNVPSQTRSGQGQLHETVEHGTWPWLALVKTLSLEMGEEGDVLCVGSLICSGWVLTSAMCLERVSGNGTIVPLEADTMTVTAGEHDRFTKEGTEQTTMVQEIIRHPNYHHGQTANNLALLRLGPNFSTNTYVRPVCVPHNESEVTVGEWDPNSDTWFAGWGTIDPESDDILEEGEEEAPSSSSDIPKQARIPLSDRGSCRLSTFGSVANDSFCAGSVGQLQDVCIGDTGGPLVVRAARAQFMLFGVAQELQGCARHQQLGVFTKVVHFTDWITDVTGGCNRN